MASISSDCRNLNIRYDLPSQVWDKVESIYSSMEGWIGFGDGVNGVKGIPYWFSFDQSEKSICASVELSGLQFYANNIDDAEWEDWFRKIKCVATNTLGFRVGELELGEVHYEIEWLR